MTASRDHGIGAQKLTADRYLVSIQRDVPVIQIRANNAGSLGHRSGKTWISATIGRFNDRHRAGRLTRAENAVRMWLTQFVYFIA